MPSDEITVFYRAGETLSRIIQEYYDFIFATIKEQIKSFATTPLIADGVETIATDDAKVGL